MFNWSCLISGCSIVEPLFKGSFRLIDNLVYRLIYDFMSNFCDFISDLILIK